MTARVFSVLEIVNDVLAHGGMVAAMPTPTDVLGHVHPARLAPYRLRCSGTASDHELLALYNWNIHLTAAFQESLGVVEVALRHSVDQQLRAWNKVHHGTDEWLSHPGAPLGTFFTSQERHKLNDYAAKARARRAQNHPRKHAPISHDDRLAQVTMGAWAFLLPKKNEADATLLAARRKLWTEALKSAFPNARNDPHGHAIGDRARRLHSLRNRVSHMENLLDVEIEQRHRDALQLINAISPELHDWLRGAARVLSVAALRPTP